MRVTIKTKCEHCSTVTETPIDLEAIQLAPVVRSNIKPAANIFEYQITSDQVKKFLVDKARTYAQNVKIEVVPRFTESKRGKKQHGSYASLRIAFSENAIERGGDNGWFGKIGDSGNIRVIPSIFKKFISIYKYDRESLKKIRDNYKYMEELEETLGISEGYLDDLIAFANPRVITTSTDEPWVFFAAAAEKVIADMLTIAETGRLPGKIEIHNIVQISKDSVMFIVHVHPGTDVREDPSVRRILLGEDKAKTP